MKMLNVSRAQQMDMERWMKKDGEEKRIEEEIVQKVTQLRKEFSHLTGVKTLTLRDFVNRFSMEQIRKAAANHLTPFHFKQAMLKLEDQTV